MARRKTAATPFAPAGVARADASPALTAVRCVALVVSELAHRWCASRRRRIRRRLSDARTSRKHRARATPRVGGGRWSAHRSADRAGRRASESWRRRSARSGGRCGARDGVEACGEVVGGRGGRAVGARRHSGGCGRRSRRASYCVTRRTLASRIAALYSRKLLPESWVVNPLSLSLILLSFRVAKAYVVPRSSSPLPHPPLSSLFLSSSFLSDDFGAWPRGLLIRSGHLPPSHFLASG